MNSLMQDRRCLHALGLVVIVALWTLPTAAEAAPLMITSAYPEASTGKLYIYGEGFGSASPAVKFAGLPVSVLSNSDVALTVFIPYGLLDNAGTYLACASRGAASDENSCIGVAVGQQGPKGDKGDMGLPGPKGDTGPIGPKGDTGVMGPKGDIGSVGPHGPAGMKGDKGDTGLTGAIGPKGDTGPQGAPGPKGDTGPQGAPAERHAVLYGGSYLLSEAPRAQCITANVVTGGCSCPAGYAARMSSFALVYVYKPWDTAYKGFACERLPAS